MDAQSEHILSISGLDVSYGDAQAVRGVSFDVARGEILGIVGESGSGKSTVLRAVAGLQGKSVRVDGSVSFDGMDLLALPPAERARLRGHRIAFVFQNPALSLDPLFSVRRQFDECLAAHASAHAAAHGANHAAAHEAAYGTAHAVDHGMARAATHGARARRGASGESREVRLATERDVLAQMGFSDPDRVLASRPDQLSGGECQRVVLAMALACESTLLLADEPTSALDVSSQQQVMDHIARMRAERGTTVVIVSHNIAAVGMVADRIGVMRGGELVELGDCDQVLHAPKHPYTRALIAAVPKADGTLPAVLSEEGGGLDVA